MWLFWIYEFLGFAAIFALIFAYCHIRNQKFWHFIWHHIKWVAISIIAVWLIIAVLCWNHFFKAAHCYFHGVSLHANTKYSIFMNECQIETPNGSYIPIELSQSYPSSSTDHAENNESDPQNSQK